MRSRGFWRTLDAIVKNFSKALKRKKRPKNGNIKTPAIESWREFTSWRYIVPSFWVLTPNIHNLWPAFEDDRRRAQCVRGTGGVLLGEWGKRHGQRRPTPLVFVGTLSFREMALMPKNARQAGAKAPEDHKSSRRTLENPSQHIKPKPTFPRKPYSSQHFFKTPTETCKNYFTIENLTEKE